MIDLTINSYWDTRKTKISKKILVKLELNLIEVARLVNFCKLFQYQTWLRDYVIYDKNIFYYTNTGDKINI